MQFNYKFALFLLIVLTSIIIVIEINYGALSELINIGFKVESNYEKLKNEISSYTNENMTNTVATMNVETSALKTTSTTSASNQNKVSSDMYVVLSCSISNRSHDDHYCFYIPSIVLAWKRIGYKSIVIVSKTKDLIFSKSDLVFLKYINKLEDTIILNLTGENDHHTEVLSMVSRIFSGAISNKIIDDNAFIITSDADMIPIDKTFFTFNSYDGIKLLNAYCCGSFKHNNGKMYRMFPMGYIGMRKKLWRDLINANFDFKPESIIETVDKELKKNLTMNEYELHKGNDIWYLDQVFVSVRIDDYTSVNNLTHLMELIHYRGLRLDRVSDASTWDGVTKDDINSYTDAHLFETKVFDLWKTVQRIFELLLPSKDIEFIKNYSDEYMSSL